MRSRRYYKKLSDAGRKAAKARWDADRKRRDAEEPARIREIELQKVLGTGPPNEGDFIGTLSWHGADGIKRKWVVRQGCASNRIRVDGTKRDHGWSWLFDKLRRHCACLTRR